MRSLRLALTCCAIVLGLILAGGFVGCTNDNPRGESTDAANGIPEEFDGVELRNELTEKQAVEDNGSAAAPSRSEESTNSIKQSVSPKQPEIAPVLEIGEFDWPQFRGPDASATQNSLSLPTQWSDSSGILWKTNLPGHGSSSPIVVGDRVFLTAYSGTGVSPTQTDDTKQLRLHLFCFDRESGQKLWQRNIVASPLMQSNDDTMLGHGSAASTPVTDGNYVYAFFGATGVYAFDMNGRLIWQQDVGPHSYHLGSSASLTIYKNLLIVNASIENKTIFSLNKTTGFGVWKIDNISRSCSMPVFGLDFDGAPEMIVSEEDFVRGFDPETGTELWHCEGFHNYVIPTPIVHDGVCYCNGGPVPKMMAIRLGGRGNVNETLKSWETTFGSNFGSPVLNFETIFLADDDGLLESYERLTGKRVSKSSTGTKTYIYASPLVANDKIYVSLQDEGVLILDADESLSEIERNKIDSDPGPWRSSLTPNGDRFFIRTDSYLYCIGENLGSAQEVKHDPASDHSDLIHSIQRVDIVAGTNRLEPYCYYIAPYVEMVVEVMLVPYRSHISEKQAIEANEIVKKNLGRFSELRSLQSDAYFEFMKGDIGPHVLKSRLAVIDRETGIHSAHVRRLIEDLLSEEQRKNYRKATVDQLDQDSTEEQ